MKPAAPPAPAIAPPSPDLAVELARALRSLTVLGVDVDGSVVIGPVGWSKVVAVLAKLDGEAFR